MNHIFKLNQDWKPEKLPELVDKIHKEIKLQENLWAVMKAGGLVL